jgi:FtsP/CotA-like multicopper oxidase with cupredoxin domain
VGFTKLNPNAKAANAAFPLQNPLGPSGTNYQVNYPYAGQCVASPTNQALFPTLPLCETKLPGANSFTCEAGAVSQRSAGGWAGCGLASAYPFKTLAPLFPDATTPKFVWEVLNPADYTPDTVMYTGADYYEIGLHEATGFQGIAAAGLFPLPPPGLPVPSGMQWTGLTCNLAGGCACPADANTSFIATYCKGGTVAAPKVPIGNPLFTPIWGVGQINMGGGPVTTVLASLGLFDNKTPVAAPWSKNDYVATWPSISIRATTGKPVVVRWVNEFPNTHVLCPHPEAADWPCAIDRTFMGVKATIDHALAGPVGSVPPDGVNRYGSPQQPDNSWVTHLHGGEIPPSTDGFAMKWFGNAITAKAYDGVGGNYLMPPFENPSRLALKRPQGNSDVYAYPIVQEEATIWFHDHSIGKTHHNVIAGPAGFFPVKDPSKHAPVVAALNFVGDGVVKLPPASEYTWLDPVTEPRNALGIPLFDLFLAVQDRAFNEDGSINFSNGLGQTPLPPPPGLGVVGQTPVTAGVNPLVHPVWVPEYFGDHSLVNGVLWPKKTVAPGWYRMRIVNGSDSRCYTSGLLAQVSTLKAPAPNQNLVGNQDFFVIANDQGYLKNPVRVQGFTMCPGERYEILVNFAGLTGSDVYLVNNAPAPFPAGFPPFADPVLGPSPWPDLNVIMSFNVRAAAGAGVASCTAAAPLDSVTNPCMPLDPTKVTDSTFVEIRGATGIVRQVYLNEKVDGVTLMPLGMQLNGVPFEYKVTETPNFGTTEIWKFVNLTVDSHPMHPHLVKHQVVGRQNLNVGLFKTELCGDIACQPGPAPGNEMQVIPNVDGVNALGAAFVTGALTPPAPYETGWKDVVQVPPNMVTTIIADWSPRWNGAGLGTVANTLGNPNAPGSVGNPVNPLAPLGTCPTANCNGTTSSLLTTGWVYEAVTAGPYVWHCHINSHEDSEMMRTSLVVP